MSGFVAEEYAETFAPPTFTVGGRTYVGVILSADAWFDNVEPRLHRLEAESTTRADLAAVVRHMTDLCFPRPWWQLWRPRMSTRLARLPWGAQLEAVAGFTAAQVSAQHGRTLGRTTTGTNGTDSAD